MIALFSQWIENLNDSMKQNDRYILLLLDNASSHKVVEIDLTNIRVCMLPPNTTSSLQPMDAGIIASFKMHYKRRQLSHAVQVIDELTEVTKENISKRKNLYAVDVLTAMQWATEAWEDVTPTTIRNCWSHTGIVPVESLPSTLQRLRITSG